MRAEGILLKGSPLSPLEQGGSFGMIPAIAHKSTRTPWDEFGNSEVVGKRVLCGVRVSANRVSGDDGDRVGILNPRFDNRRHSVPGSDLI